MFDHDNEGCKNPIGCKKRRIAFQIQNEISVKKYGEKEFEMFRLSFQKKGFDFLEKAKDRNHENTHAEDRAFQRSISEQEIHSVFLDGDIIEYFQGNGIKKMLICGSYRYGKGKYRPIHVVLRKEMTAGSTWSIATLYDPRSMPWLWDQKTNFTERVCFCKRK